MKKYTYEFTEDEAKLLCTALEVSRTTCLTIQWDALAGDDDNLPGFETLEAMTKRIWELKVKLRIGMEEE